MNMQQIRQVTAPAGRALVRMLARLRVGAAVFGYLMLGLSPAFADDIDIYTKNVATGGGGAPVIMFQLDTSGSMMWKLGPESAGDTSFSTSTSRLMNQRLYRMVDVTTGQSTGMPGRFKLGVLRYSGGSTGIVLAEAKPLAETFSSAPAAGGTSVFEIESELHDAQGWQYDNTNGTTAGGRGAYDLGEGDLTLGELSSQAPDPSSGSSSPTWRMHAAPLPATWVGSWPSQYPDVDLPPQTGSAGQVNGMLAGAAGNVVLWYRHGGTSNAQTFRITGATANSFSYLTSVNAGTVHRSADTTAAATAAECTGTAGNDSCINHSMTRNTWYRVVIGTNAVNQVGTFSIQMMYPTRGTWYLERLPPQVPARVGVNFTRVDIPQGATITNAYVEFRPRSTANTTARMRVGIDDAVVPDSLRRTDLFSRSVTWNTPAAVGNWTDNAEGPSTRFSVTSLLQAKVNQPGWCNGGDATFLVDGLINSNASGSVRVAHAYDSWNTDDDRPARLVVEWTAPAVPPPAGCEVREFVIPLRSSSDDVAQAANGAITYDGISLPVSGTQKIGLRFPLLPIPPKSEILDARLELTAHANGTAQKMAVQVAAENVARPFAGDTFALDALAFTQDAGTGDDSVGWLPADWVEGQTYVSPDLSALINPLTYNEDWEYDGALAFVISGSVAGTAQVRAWERHLTQTAVQATSIKRAEFGAYAAVLRLTVRAPDAMPVQRTRRYAVTNTLNRLPASGSTPIVGSYLVAARYMLGWHPTLPMPVLASGDCSTNGIVALTDGEENSGYPGDFVTQVRTITGNVTGGTVCGTGSNTAKWRCMYDMMSALYNKRNNHADTQKYSIRTDTVMFGPEASSGLAGTEGKGGGKFYDAKSAAVLVNAFKEIISNMSVSAGSVAAPGVAVNALNKFEHLDELYYALFKPETTVGWRGNLKRYRLKDSEIVDVHGNPALSDTTGLFATGTQSWWSDALDDGVATIGGAGGELKVPADRVMYTYLGANGTALNVPLAPAVGPDRDGVGAEIIHPDNTHLTAARIGADQLTLWPTLTATQREARRRAIIQFLRGEAGGQPRLQFGAAIHSSPSLVTYGTEGSGATATGINTIFVSDNEGVLHMIDTGAKTNETNDAANVNSVGGTELFAFVPKEALPNIAHLQDNTRQIASEDYIYGMDGTWVPWKYDVNLDGTIDAADGDLVYIYGGMRRGGRNYYALDVTTVRRGSTPAPVLKWVVEGGSAGAYANMGQTWADPTPRWVLWNNVRRRVVFLSGGYDPAFHDNMPGFTNADQRGRQVYMVDAITGQLLWWASSQATASTVVPAMRYSITAAPVTMDRNGNGVVDGMYVVDLAGQVFRFDFNEGATNAAGFVRNNTAVLVGRFGATDAGADTVLDNRRFYDSPAVALVRTNAGGDLMIALTSGYRESPGSTTTQEKVIFFRDVGAWNIIPPARPVLGMADLAVLPDTGALTEAAMLMPGWQMNLDRSKGEKGMGTPVFFNFALLFSTYVPKGVITDLACAPDIGFSRLYAMNALTGAGIVNDELDNASSNQRYVDEAMPGLGSTVQMLYMDGQLTVLAGTLAIATKDDAATGKKGLEDDSSDLLNAGVMGSVGRLRWYEVNE